MNINIIDICILAVIGVSVVFGLYRGFISGVLSVGAVIGSTAFAFAAGGQLAAWLSSNQTLVDTLRYYTVADDGGPGFIGKRARADPAGRGAPGRV